VGLETRPDTDAILAEPAREARRDPVHRGEPVFRAAFETVVSASVGTESPAEAAAGGDPPAVLDELTDQLRVHVLVHGDLLPTAVNPLHGPPWT
jgi:hypothetical protein